MFDEFWSLYPRRVAKRAAVKAWSKLTDEEKAEAIATIGRHVDYWRQTDREIETIPHASTWLNQGRWEDELPNVVIKPSKNGVVSKLTGNVYGLRRVG